MSSRIFGPFRCASSCLQFVIPLRYFSNLTTSSSASTAEALLNASRLKSGEVLVQNEADSDVGKAVIQLAKDRGIKTINIVADKPGTPQTVEHLKSIGGDIVVTESYTNTWFIKQLLSDIQKPSLGLNGSDGSSAIIVAKLLGDGGIFLTYGKKLPKNVVYPGAERHPIEWSQFLKARKLKTQFL